MGKRLIKSLILLPSAITSLSFATILTSCNDQPTSQITITFDAGDGGYIVGTDQQTIDVKIEKGTTWSDIKDRPKAWFSKMFVFDFWSIDNETEVKETYVLKDNDVLIAKYKLHSHDYDAYKVEEVTCNDGSKKRIVKGHCTTCDEYFQMPDEWLEEMQGRFLIENSDQTFTLSDKDVTISDYISKTTKSELHIYPIGVHYLSGDKSDFKLYIHGLCNSEYQPISYIDSYNDEDFPGEGQEKIHYLRGVNLIIDNSILYGKDEPLVWMGGIQATELSCDHCTLKGQMATYSEVNRFTNCIFDTTEMKNDTDYAIYCYVGPTLIENCSFVSKGKAIKIFTNGAANNYTEIYDCKFTIVQYKKEKAAIEIDPTYHTTERKCVVYVNGCQLDETYTTKGLGLYATDDAEKTEIHTERKG